MGNAGPEREEKEVRDKDQIKEMQMKVRPDTLLCFCARSCAQYVFIYRRRALMLSLNTRSIHGGGGSTRFIMD